MPNDDGARRTKLAGSLDEGIELPSAASVAVGLCPGADLVGFDLLDLDGKPFAHAHFNLHEAIAFHQALGASIAELAIVTGATQDPNLKGTRH